jgi:hypothetical protein
MNSSPDERRETVRGQEIFQKDLPAGARNRFEAYFSETVRVGDCWLPVRQPMSERPSIVLAGVKYPAARLAYAIYRGDIGRGLYVCHSCDTQRCINPDHLWLGTPKQNSEDMSAKGRHWRTARMLARLNT